MSGEVQRCWRCTRIFGLGPDERLPARVCVVCEERATACARALRGIEDPEGAVAELVEAAVYANTSRDEEAQTQLGLALAPFLSARARRAGGES